eukprot:3461532-Karenia_brevis.AAC.1
MARGKELHAAIDGVAGHASHSLQSAARWHHRQGPISEGEVKQCLAINRRANQAKHNHLPSSCSQGLS